MITVVVIPKWVVSKMVVWLSYKWILSSDIVHQLKSQEVYPPAIKHSKCAGKKGSDHQTCSESFREIKSISPVKRSNSSLVIFHQSTSGISVSNTSAKPITDSGIRSNASTPTNEQTANIIDAALSIALGDHILHPLLTRPACETADSETSVKSFQAGCNLSLGSKMDKSRRIYTVGGM